MRQMRNVFEAILKYGHDEDFVPAEDDEFLPGWQCGLVREKNSNVLAETPLCAASRCGIRKIVRTIVV